MEFDELLERLDDLIALAKKAGYWRFAGALSAVRGLAREDRIGYARRLEPRPSTTPTRLPVGKGD